MNKLFTAAILVLAILSAEAFAQNKTYFQRIAGDWEGTLEYLDYQENKRVKLKTCLTVTPASDGNSAEILTIYDDFGRIIKNVETVKIDAAAKKYVSGKFEYAVDSIGDGKIVLLGKGQDGEKVEPIRQTITFDENSLVFLKETRTPWQFRNQTILKRVNSNAPAKCAPTARAIPKNSDVLKRASTTVNARVYRYRPAKSSEKIVVRFESRVESFSPESAIVSTVN